MSAVRTIAKVKAFLAVTAVVLGLAATAGPLTAAGFSREVSGSPGVPSSRIGEPTVTDTVLYADDSPDLFAKAGAVRDALGFPAGAARSGRHVKDGLQNAEYDEVADLDSAGQPISLTQFDGRGRLVSAVRFDLPPRLSAKVTSDQASKAAQGVLARSGLMPSGKARVEPNPVAGGWDVHWPRTEAGFPVRGDETSVHVWQDGRIQGVARVEHEVSALPSKRLGQADAKDVVTHQFDAWFTGRGSGYAVQNMDLEWVEPNAAFDAGKIGAAPAPCRLAWVANVTPSGAAAEVIWQITLYVDAGNGTVIGGDVVE
jgi:hypothetical protein